MPVSQEVAAIVAALRRAAPDGLSPAQTAEIGERLARLALRIVVLEATAGGAVIGTAPDTSRLRAEAKQVIDAELRRVVKQHSVRRRIGRGTGRG